MANRYASNPQPQKSCLLYVMMAKDDTQQSELEADLNYFVGTLGQAAAINARTPHPWKTVNDLIDHQAETCPDAPAVGFPLPSNGKPDYLGWDFTLYSMCS